jgi:selenide,water dikinase
VLDAVLGKLARQQDRNVLVGFDKADDAGVYLISADTALVQSVDFFTPIVDDPYVFGQIAAVNALSDVYAMGGRPLTALALVCFPEKGDVGVLEKILVGGLSKMIEARCTVIGGHSIRDDELKFGYSVTGTIHPADVLANSGALPGDKLILTKALGTGVISTAIKQGRALSNWIEAAVASMTTLNRAAAEVVAPASSPAVGEGVSPSTRQDGGATKHFRVHACTDITGFGFLGHARELALASQVSLRIAADSIPLLEGAQECVQAGFIPGGLKANREFAECVVECDHGVSEVLRTLLFDPQTAGGLLVAVAADDAAGLLRALREHGVPAVEVGEVLPPAKPLIAVTR